MTEIKAYACDYCHKYYKHKSSAIRHEKQCFYNPINKACLSCGNFKTDYNTIYVPPYPGNNYGDNDYEEKYNYCAHDEKIFGHGEGEKRFQNNCNYWVAKEGDTP